MLVGKDERSFAKFNDLEPTVVLKSAETVIAAR